MLNRVKGMTQQVAAPTAPRMPPAIAIPCTRLPAGFSDGVAGSVDCARVGPRLLSAIVSSSLDHYPPRLHPVATTDTREKMSAAITEPRAMQIGAIAARTGV